MRRYLWYGITLIAWIVAIVIFAGAYAHHQLLQLAPIFAYNRPQGVFGWTLAIAVVFTFVSIGAHNRWVYQRRYRQHKP